MTDFVQVPPQSTGKKVGTEARTEVPFDNLVGALFSAGQIVTGANSSATGTVTGVLTDSATSGSIYLENVTGTFTNNEDLEVLSTPIASVDGSSFNTIEQQKVVITDPGNPARMQKIDRFGATVNTFTDGSPIFSPFGLMMTGQPQTIKDYRFAYNEQASLFYDQETVGATIAYDSDPGVILLTNPTTTGALASRSSHFYHPYIPGTGTCVEMSMVIGDAGKTNVARRWGLFDDDNGVFWELNGTTLSVVIRSDSTGSIVEDSVSQASFSDDKLDGSDSLNFTLDVTAGNIYWVDYQWLGVGRVRFGIVEPNGSRVLVHTFKNANSSADIPYMRTGTLPIRVEQENTGTAGSTSEFRWICASVKHTEQSPINGNNLQSASTGTTLVNFADTDGLVPIIAVRPKTAFNTLTNRGIIRLLSTSYVNIGSLPVIVTVGFTVEGSMTAESFASHGTGSIAEIDTTATALTFVEVMSTQLIAPGEVARFSQFQSDQVHKYETFLEGDGTTQTVIAYAAEVVGTGSADVGITLNWEEILA